MEQPEARDPEELGVSYRLQPNKPGSAFTKAQCEQRRRWGSECLYFRAKENFSLLEKAVSTQGGANLVNGKLAEMGIAFLFDVRAL